MTAPKAMPYTSQSASPARRDEMKQRFMIYGFTIALGIGLATLSTATRADDTKAPDKEPPTKAPDYSNYKGSKSLESVEIVKADDKKIVIKIPYTGTRVVNGRQVPVQMKKEVDYQFVSESLVRTKVLPPKFDGNGKKVTYTDKEKAALKVPMGVVGYAANNSDLAPGTTIDLVLFHDKSIPEVKLTEEDWRIKYAVITAWPTTPAKKQN
jgi:hypothetical protein